jgi:hypothetical protein
MITAPFNAGAEAIAGVATRGGGGVVAPVVDATPHPEMKSATDSVPTVAIAVQRIESTSFRSDPIMPVAEQHRPSLASAD